MPATRVSSAADSFIQHRDLLFTVAYEMLGSAADAEDVVQDVSLRWLDVDHTTVRDPRAYLVRITSRLALNRLRTVRRQRETYVGPWLPEPLATTGDLREDIELAESVSFAMLVVLETLTPAERAAFILRDVFDVGYAEIGRAIGKSNAAVRQLSHRARAKVRARRPRRPVAREDHAAASERFFHAVAGGDIQSLMDVLSPGVVLLTDGGGKAQAALRPVVGAARVARFLTGVRPDASRLRFTHDRINGAASMIVHLDGVLDGVIGAATEGGLVTRIYIIRNPEKLGALGGARQRLHR